MVKSITIFVIDLTMIFIEFMKLNTKRIHVRGIIRSIINIMIFYFMGIRNFLFI